MSESTRRAFVKNSAVAAAGMTAVGALTAETAQALATPQDESSRGSVVAYVRDARTGEISLMAGERNITIRDRGLATRIARAAR
jgi:hypothetical protein